MHDLMQLTGSICDAGRPKLDLVAHAGLLTPEALAYVAGLAWCERPAWQVQPKQVHQVMFYRTLVKQLVGGGGR